MVFYYGFMVESRKINLTFFLFRAISENDFGIKVKQIISYPGRLAQRTLVFFFNFLSKIN